MAGIFRALVSWYGCRAEAPGADHGRGGFRCRILSVTHRDTSTPVSVREFRAADTEVLFPRWRAARFSNIERPAPRRLMPLDLARRIEDRRAPPGSRLERLEVDRADLR